MTEFHLDPGPPGHMRLRCHGALDLASRAEFGAACAAALEQAGRQLVVDLTEVEIIDCGCIRLLDDTGELQVGQGGDFEVVCTSPFLRKVLVLTGFAAKWDPGPAGAPVPRSTADLDSGGDRRAS